MSKRPRDRSSATLRVVTIDGDTDVQPVFDSLESFVAPIGSEEFMKSEFRKRPCAFRAHPRLQATRLEALKEAMDGFSPMEMLEASNSDGIHVWMKTTEGTQKSIKVEPAQAKVCYDAGHALYFRASELLESTLLPALANDLGFGFGSKYRDGARRAEIETFVAKPGHLTRWHWDFQENFTVQLKGAKKWSFYKGPVQHPHRACATHFDGPEHVRTLHTQLQTARIDDPGFDLVPEDIDANCESVVLQEGDVLYHPAGVWHQVESIGTGPSLSINLSFFPPTWAELLGESVQHLWLTNASLRERISYTSPGDLHRVLSARIQQAAQMVSLLSANDVCPVAVCDPQRRPSLVFWKDDDSVEADVAVVPMSHCRVRRSRLSILSQTPSRVAFERTAGSDSDEDEQETVSEIEGYSRFDLTGNFLAEDSGFGSPAVSATFFVAVERVPAMAKLALLGFSEVDSRSLKVSPSLLGALVALGYLSPVA